MQRFKVSLILLLPIVAVAQSTVPSTAPSTDPTPEASTRPNSVRRSRAMEALSILGDVNPQNEANVQRVVEVVERQNLGDSRLMPCELRVRIVDGKASLEGYCLLAEQKSVVLDDLRRVGLTNIEDHVAVGSIGGDRPFAIVQNEPISVTAKPGKSEQLTVWPTGSVLFLLQQQGDSFLALGPDGYAGFVGAARVERVSAAELKSGETKPPFSGRARLPSFESMPQRRAGSPPTQNGKTNPTALSTADNPIGGTNPTSRHAADIELAISSASKLLGTKYVWGGIDASGVDCSGLTRCAFESVGMHLPRDADQQALVGQLVATRWYRDDLRRGDLLFFAGRRGTISHVAIYLGNQNFLEAADGKVQFSSFDPASPDYREKRLDSFCLAKRILE